MPTYEHIKIAEDNSIPGRAGTALSDHARAAVANDLAGKADATQAVPVGGTTGQVLVKNTATDNDVTWISVADNTVLATAADFPGLDPTGATNSQVGFTNAIAATPDGGNLVLPAGTYRLDSTVRIDNKNIHLWGDGATLVKNHAAAMFDIAGSYGTIHAVTGITTGTVTTNGSSGPSTVLTVGAAAGYKVGDVVKVYADDVIPEARPGDGIKESRVGRWMVVHASDATTVTLVGSLNDSFTTNIKVARINDYTVSLHGINARASDTVLGAKDNTPMFNFTNMVNPVVENVTIEAAQGPGFQFISCFKYVVRDSTVAYADNDTTVGNYGYGIADFACAFGRVDGYTARRVRHAWTDDTSRITTNSDITDYGRSYGAVISNSSAIGCSDAAWDTHAAGEAHTFTALTATDARGAALQLRGRNHVVNSLTAVRADRGIKMFCESAGGASYGHTVNGFTAHALRDSTIWANVNPTGHPSAGVRETRPSHFSGIRSYDSVTRVLAIENTTITFSDTVIGVRANGWNNMSAVQLTNSDFYAESLVLDYRANTSGTGLTIIGSTGTGSAVELRSLRVRNVSGHATRMSGVFAVTADTVARVHDSVFDYAPASTAGPAATGSVFQWRLTTEKTASRFVTAADPTSATVLGEIRLASDPVVTVETYQTVNAVLGALPDPVVNGQILNIVNCSSGGYTLTINHDPVTANVSTTSGTNLVLAVDETASFIYSTKLSAWRQLSSAEPPSWDGTQAEYDALVTKDANTTYYITG